jgi:hypothetical protein
VARLGSAKLLLRSNPHDASITFKEICFFLILGKNFIRGANKMFESARCSKKPSKKFEVFLITNSSELSFRRRRNLLNYFNEIINQFYRDSSIME